jgi:hypothetical protein
MPDSLGQPSKVVLDRYQVTASIYDRTDPQFPGLIIFEFVNYGHGDQELAGIVEVSAQDDADLGQLVIDATERLAQNSILPLTVEGQALLQSGVHPTNWRVMMATGSKTDFVLWVEVEAVSHGGDFTTIRSGHVSGAVARRLQAEWDTVFNAVVERKPTSLLPIQHECSTCGASWEAGEHSKTPGCPECGGFAKERQCNCKPGCGATVIRDTAATHLDKRARTFPCPDSDARGIDWTGDSWAIEALARKLSILEK